MAGQPTTERGRVTRDRIIQTAVEIVGERGAPATAIDDVCARAQVSKSQLYHYFADRDDLIRTVVDATSDGLMTLQAGLLDEFDSLPGIRRYLDALVALQERRHARGGCPIGSLAGQLAETDEPARQAIADGMDRWQTRLRDGLAQMRERGELRPDTKPGQLATQALALLQGGLLLCQVHRDPQQLRTSANAILTLIHAHAC